MPSKYFRNRLDAGQQLAQVLRPYKNNDAVVLALPRGGVVVGAEVARLLHLPLGVVQVRKIAHPYLPEYAVGAVAEDDEPLYNEREAAIIDPTYLQRTVADARKIIAQRRTYYYHDDVLPPEVAGKTVIIVDDGIATGLTIRAALHAMRRKRPRHIIIAVPVMPSDATAELQEVADAVISLGELDKQSGAVGAYYEYFEQVNDEDVRTLLQAALKSGASDG